MVAVSDSSPLLLFTGIGRLALLNSLFGEVIVPKAVWIEVVTNGNNRPGAAEVSGESWIRQIGADQSSLLPELTDELGQGEAEAIAVAIQLGGQTPLILDDRKGRRIATALGLPVVGSAGVLLLAKEAGFIPQVRSLLDELRLAGLYLDDATLNEIVRLAGEGPLRPQIH